MPVYLCGCMHLCAGQKRSKAGKSGGRTNPNSVSMHTSTPSHTWGRPLTCLSFRRLEMFRRPMSLRTHADTHSKKKKKKKKKKGNATQQPKQSWTAHKLAPKSLFVTTPCLVWRTHSTLHTPHFTLHTLNTHVMVEVAFVGAGNTTPPWATQWFVPRDGVTRMATANRASTARPADTNQALGWWRVPNTACLFASPIRSLLPLFLLFVFFVACVNGDDWCTKATTHKQQNNGLLVWSSTPQNRV